MFRCLKSFKEAGAEKEDGKLFAIDLKLYIDYLYAALYPAESVLESKQ